ncbi:MAG: hypothetical protein QXI32_05415 [Candidatus Bathyarchaeia archaeon]
MRKYNLKALAGNSRPGLMMRGIHVHLAASLLSEEGIPAQIHEHDVPAEITGLPAYTGEFNYIEDLPGNVFKLGHTGFSAFSLAESPKDIPLAKFDMYRVITGREWGGGQFPC